MSTSRLFRAALALVLFCVCAVAAAVVVMVTMPGRPSDVTTRTLDAEESATRERLRGHVEFLASQPRNRVHAPEHERAAVEHIEAALRAQGYAPVRQPVETPDGVFHNILARIPGSAQADELIVIGAHWDTCGPTPGADDNASGVAALLEVSGWLASKQPARTVELAFWATEEPPYFQRNAMGSLVHARSLAATGANVVWMLSLEMLGYYDPREGAQHYPPGLSLFYPTHGAFAAFVGSMWHRSAVTQSIEIMRATSDFPLYGFAGPERMPGIGFSDHWSFWQVGYPGVMLTDTSFFRTPHYHEPTDTPDTLDWDRYARLVVALRPLVGRMAGLR